MLSLRSRIPGYCLIDILADVCPLGHPDSRRKTSYYLGNKIDGPTTRRDRISVAEIMWEHFGVLSKDREYKTLATLVRRYLRTSKTWMYEALPKRIKGYGQHRIYSRTETT